MHYLDSLRVADFEMHVFEPSHNSVDWSAARSFLQSAAVGLIGQIGKGRRQSIRSFSCENSVETLPRTSSSAPIVLRNGRVYFETPVKAVHAELGCGGCRCHFLTVHSTLGVHWRGW